jgi:cyclopropane-fatty-acyl-phospholipid synthase
MNTPFRSLPPRSQWNGPAPEQEFYQSYTPAEDKQHTNVHYEQPPEFFYAITGGTWNVYSCNWWEGTTTDTEAQEAKLDLFARMMDLKPGQRILDVGCGWAGPLVYLSTKYGVEGVGLTLSPTQKSCADERIARHKAYVTVYEQHWAEYEDDRPFDAIYTDEVIVHFQDLQGFFDRAHALLKPRGYFLNKELHFSSSYYKTLGRGDVFVNEIYGLTGNYRTLGEELTMLDAAGFELQGAHPMAKQHYRIQADRWQANMSLHRDRLQQLVGKDYYRRFRTYLKLVGRIFSGDQMTIDIVVSRKL